MMAMTIDNYDIFDYADSNIDDNNNIDNDQY